MCFSKKERELLERMAKRDIRWFYKHYSYNYNTESIEEGIRKHNYYRQLKSRINKKVKTMKKDLELFDKASDLRFNPNY